MYFSVTVVTLSINQPTVTKTVAVAVYRTLGSVDESVQNTDIEYMSLRVRLS